MPNYRVSVTRTTSFWLYFTAEDREQAEDLITAWECGEIDQEDIPDQEEKEYSFEQEINDGIEGL